MGDSFEKRQRERRKQQKRREKAARKQDPTEKEPGTGGPSFIELDDFLGESEDPEAGAQGEGSNESAEGPRPSGTA